MRESVLAGFGRGCSVTVALVAPAGIVTRPGSASKSTPAAAEPVIRYSTVIAWLTGPTREKVNTAGLPATASVAATEARTLTVERVSGERS